jgi:hypothetical protein
MKISDLQPDKRNANKGTKRGHDAVVHSLKNLGAGRSILIDREGRIIAGNKTAANAAAAGIEDVIVVQTTGDQIVAVQRTDLNLESDPKAKALAVADNRTAEVGLEWDPVVLSELSTELDLKPFFSAVELRELTGVGGEGNDVRAEYAGMPEYTSDDQRGVRHLIVHFSTHEAVKEFARLIGQTISEKAKFIWFPEMVREDLAGSKYVEDSASVPDLHPDAQ